MFERALFHGSRDRGRHSGGRGGGPVNRAERRAAERAARKARQGQGQTTDGPGFEPVDDTLDEAVLDDPGAMRPTTNWSAFEPLRSELVVESGVLVPWGGPVSDAAFGARFTVARLAEPIADRLHGDAAFERYAAATCQAVDEAVADLFGLRQAPDRLAKRPWDAPRLLALFRAAEDAFGLPPYRPLRAFATWPASEEFSAEHGGALRAFLRAQYAETQAWLREFGVDRAQLWRGMAVPAPDGFGQVAVTLRSLSSWTVSMEDAIAFAIHRARRLGGAARLLLAEAPAARILSVGATGLAAVGAAEVVVLSGPTAAWAMTWHPREVKIGPLFREQTYRMAAEAWEEGRRSGLPVNPVWAPDWSRRVREG